MSESRSNAFERGAARARELHRLFNRHGVIGAAVNPYRRPETRADWSAGFRSAY